MNISFQIDTSIPITDAERRVLIALAGGVPDDLDNKPVVQEAEPVKRTRGPNKPKEPVDTAPETDPDDDTRDQDVPEVAKADDDGPSLGDAVARATQLVSLGKKAEVKAALDVVGAKRVGELKGDAITAFLEALDA